MQQKLIILARGLAVALAAAQAYVVAHKVDLTEGHAGTPAGIIEKSLDPTRVGQ